MKKFSIVLLFIFILFLNFSFVSSAAAQVNLQDQIMGQVEAGAAAAELGEQDPRMIVATIIKVFLGLLGTIFLILVFMGGYWLITARGEEEKIKKAQSTIKRAVIGLIIILLSYAIVNFVASGIQNAILGN